MSSSTRKAVISLVTLAGYASSVSWSAAITRPLAASAVIAPT